VPVLLGQRLAQRCGIVHWVRATGWRYSLRCGALLVSVGVLLACLSAPLPAFAADQFTLDPTADSFGPIVTDAAGNGACDAHRRGAALVTRYVVVYGLPGSETATTPLSTTYYACRRPAGERANLGIDEMGSLYGSDATTGGFVAAGTYVAAQSSRGEADLAICARYNNSRLCPAARHWLTVVDTETGRRAHVPIYARLPVPALVPFPVTVALSAEGAVAWLQNSTVGANVTSKLQLWATALKPRGRSILAAAPAMLDSGSIDPASLRFQDRTLYWVGDGARHHQALGS